MSWFELPPVLRALTLGSAAFLTTMLALVPLMGGLKGISRGGRGALAAVPAGLLSAATLALGGAVGALHPWPFSLAAATGLIPIGLMAIGAWALPAYHERRGGPRLELPPPPLPATAGRDKPLVETPTPTPTPTPPTAAPSPPATPATPPENP